MGRLLMVASDRISAFDVVLPRAIPFKGQVLNQLAGHMLEAVSELVPVWLEATPDPNVAVGKCCEPIRLEMVIRGHLNGTRMAHLPRRRSLALWGSIARGHA